jgi:hypothetical protein
MKAKLRVCASCEWLFFHKENLSCPKCDFASYGAHYVYGKKAYTYIRTQEPWKRKKMWSYESKLDDEIKEAFDKQFKSKPLEIEYAFSYNKQNK